MKLMRRYKGIQEIRRENLSAALALHDAADLIERLGITRQRMHYLKQQSIGEAAAREIEKALRLPKYWLDNVHLRKRRP